MGFTKIASKVLKSGADYAVVIGDVVDSKKVNSQEDLLSDLQAAHLWLNEHVNAVEPMTSTVGDEFQGVYQSVDQALTAAVLLRLRLLGRYDIRIGIGWGTITSVAPDRAPFAQSGAGWWCARAAVEQAAELAGKSGWPRYVRTRVQGLPPRVQPPVLAFLLCQDHLLATMDEKDAQIALGLFAGQLQAELVDELGIAQSSVSRRQSENGPSTIYRAYQMLEKMLP